MVFRKFESPRFVAFFYLRNVEGPHIGFCHMKDVHSRAELFFREGFEHDNAVSLRCHLFGEIRAGGGSTDNYYVVIHFSPLSSDLYRSFFSDAPGLRLLLPVSVRPAIKDFSLALNMRFCLFAGAYGLFFLLAPFVFVQFCKGADGEYYCVQ